MMKIEDMKKIGIKNLVLIMIAGILLLMCTMSSKMYGRNKNNDADIATDNISAVTPVPDDEIRLEELLSQVEGAGKTEVMIVYQNDIRTEIEGIVVVTEGAAKSYVVQYISDAAEALFGIPKHKIIVLPMKTENGSK